MWGYFSFMTKSAIHWIFYSSDMGRSVVLDEIRKMNLGIEEMNTLEQTLRSIASGISPWHSAKHLEREIWEARIRFPHRQIRVLYSIETAWFINLALFAAVKKVQKVPRQWINLALKRRKDWLHRMNDHG